ncbi:MAG: hypothetical protein IKO63_07825 [Paludibacteraceae bacterium]|nr:hypothetical protein [Paludibacteraceae bacterium]
MKKRNSSTGKFKRQPRNHPVTVLLNDSEMRTITRYCERYKYHNRSEMIRRTLMRAILKKFDADSPTLFD